VFHLGDETGRTVDVKMFVASQEEPDQVVETEEVVDMGMGDEDMRQAQDFSGRQCPYVSQVEEQGAAVVEKVDVERRVVEGAVDQGGMEPGRHGLRSGEGSAAWQR